MLSIRGLLIIASEPEEIISKNDYLVNINFWAASETLFKKTIRHMVFMSVKKTEVDEVKSKIVIGKIIEIEHAHFYETSKYTKTPDLSNKFSKVVLCVDSKNIKFLSPVTYYENITNVTTPKAHDNDD